MCYTGDMNTENVAEETKKSKSKSQESFELFKSYELKYPVTRGNKTITNIRVEVPSGKQLLALDGKKNLYEMVAGIVSMCSMDDKFTEGEVLDFKSPDLNSLIEVLGDFLQ